MADLPVDHMYGRIRLISQEGLEMPGMPDFVKDLIVFRFFVYSKVQKKMRKKNTAVAVFSFPLSVRFFTP